MKKLILLTVLFLSLLTIKSEAATYYVRADGGPYGTSGTTVCNGADAQFTGSNGPNCAVKSLYELIRHGIDETGTFAGTTRISAGDTIIIGAPDGLGGSNDQFVMGYNTTSPPTSCYAGASYGCYLDVIPAGTSTANRTKIYGRGWDTGCTGKKAQLWGNERVRRILAISGNVDIQCLDITDHSPCFTDSVAGDIVDGVAASCNGSTSPFGQWAQDGIWLNGSGNYLKNVDIHGLSRYGMTTRGTFGDNTLENVRIQANGWGGFSTGENDIASGTMTFLNNSMEWNGCGERYPLQSSTLNSTLNIHHCMSQGQNGAASPDGFAFGLTGSGNAGNYIFNGGSYSWNTGDGIDTLHGTGNGTMVVYRVKAEGNGGQQVKFNALNQYLENSKVMGNCGFFHGQTFTSTKNNAGVTTTFASCRALGDVIALIAGANTKAYVYNNTITSNGNIGILWTGSGCDANSRLESKNNIFIGGQSYFDDTFYNAAGGNKLTNYIYFGGSDGNGSGTCGTSFSNYVSQNNIVRSAAVNNFPCGGTGDQCGTGFTGIFTGTIKQGGGSASAYYQGTDYADQINLVTGSPAINAGQNGLTYQGGATDFNGFTRVGTFDIGALEFGSTGGGPTAVCGNNTAESGEVCDGTDLASQTCVSQGYDTGTLTCNSNCLSFNFSGCSFNASGTAGTHLLGVDFSQGVSFK